MVGVCLRSRIAILRVLFMISLAKKKLATQHVEKSKI
jgi:hypothetical protein